MTDAAAPGVLAARPFRRFGRSAFLSASPPSVRLEVSGDRREMRKLVRSACPPTAGVYGMVDHAGRLIYVGMSTRLRDRIITYFQGDHAGRKESRIGSRARQLVWENLGHAFVAHLRELELIRRFRPEFNIKGRRRDDATGYIYLTCEEAPRFRLGPRLPSAVRDSWGPLPIHKSTRKAIEQLNWVLRLRDCPQGVRMRFADQRLLFPLGLRAQCLRGEIGTCSAPCAAHCSREDYLQQLRAGRAFLNGEEDNVLPRLETLMLDAARSLQFERAARFRQILENLQVLARQLANLRDPGPQHGIYPLEISKSCGWYFIASGVVCGMTPAPTNQALAKDCLKRIQDLYRGNAAPRQLPDRSAAQIVTRWFHQFPDERRRIMTTRAAVAACLPLAQAS